MIFMNILKEEKMREISNWQNSPGRKLLSFSFFGLKLSDLYNSCHVFVNIKSHLHLHYWVRNEEALQKCLQSSTFTTSKVEPHLWKIKHFNFSPFFFCILGCDDSIKWTIYGSWSFVTMSNNFYTKGCFNQS